MKHKILTVVVAGVLSVAGLDAQQKQQRRSGSGERAEQPAPRPDGERRPRVRPAVKKKIGDAGETRREQMRRFLEKHPDVHSRLRKAVDRDGDGKLSPAERAALRRLVHREMAGAIEARREHRQDVRENVREHRQGVRENVREHRQDVRENVREHRQDVRENVTEHRQGVRENVRDHRQDVRENVRERRQDVREDVRERRQDARENVRDHRQDARQDRRDNRSDRRDDRQQTRKKVKAGAKARAGVRGRRR